MKIIWLSNSRTFHQSIRNNSIVNGAKGGVVYNFQVYKILSKHFDLHVVPQFERKYQESIVRYWARISKYKVQSDIIIKDPTIMALYNKKSAARELSIIHHIEETSSWKKRFYYKQMLKNAKRLDGLVVVSNFWKNYFLSNEINRIFVIYNSFNMQDFRFHEDNITSFMAKYNLNKQKPIIYIGNANYKKGIFEVFEVLKNKNYLLVTSGYNKSKINIPVLNLELVREEYLLLLRTCDLVITMSKMTEGWNRTAHEALLCGTPVIGNGKGGMMELLKGGNQFITNSYSGLPGLIEEVLQKKTKMAEDGFNYCKKFDIQYFESKWIKIINAI